MSMLPCGLCDERFFSNDDLKEHFNGHESQLIRETEIKHEQDSDQYSDAGSLNLDCVKEEEQLQGEVKYDESSLVQSKKEDECRTLHERGSSSKTFMCSKCSYKISNKQKFKAHMNQMHLYKIKCEYCPKSFSSGGRLAYHIRKEHVKDEDKPKLPEDEFFRLTKKKQGNRNRRVYECLKCTFKDHGRSHIYQHIRGVHRELLEELYKSKGMILGDAGYHKCTECFFKTSDMRNLKRHIETVHQKRRDFVCDLCMKTFSAKGALLQHMKHIHISAESSEQHKCSICTYKTINKTNLKKHLNMVHFKIREFTCDLCQIKFPTISHVRTHIERHHLEKNILSCDRDSNCSFRTANKRELLRHIRRVHEKIQDFSCEICGKWYTSQDGLKSHKETEHLTIGRLTCDLCQATSKDRKNIHDHMKRKHLKKDRAW